MMVVAVWLFLDLVLQVSVKNFVEKWQKISPVLQPVFGLVKTTEINSIKICKIQRKKW